MTFSIIIFISVHCFLIDPSNALRFNRIVIEASWCRHLADTTSVYLVDIYFIARPWIKKRKLSSSCSCSATAILKINLHLLIMHGMYAPTPSTPCSSACGTRQPNQGTFSTLEDKVGINDKIIWLQLLAGSYVG